MPVFEVNGRRVEVEDGDRLLLWVLREDLGLTGTRFGCGVGQCGSCTVHRDGEPVRSCLLPASALEGASITTIEGLTSEGRARLLQEAWIEHQVPQCGYCQSGQIMQAAPLLDRATPPTREEIVRHMNPVLCRCGTYLRIVAAVQAAVAGTAAPAARGAAPSRGEGGE